MNDPSHPDNSEAMVKVEVSQEFTFLVEVAVYIPKEELLAFLSGMKSLRKYVKCHSDNFAATVEIEEQTGLIFKPIIIDGMRHDWEDKEYLIPYNPDNNVESF